MITVVKIPTSQVTYILSQTQKSVIDVRNIIGNVNWEINSFHKGINFSKGIILNITHFIGIWEGQLSVTRDRSYNQECLAFLNMKQKVKKQCHLGTILVK